MSIFVRLYISLFWVMGLAWLFTPTPTMAATIAEVEPNNNAQEAQLLSTIGLDTPVAAAINTPGDQDWYKFEAVTGRTYVVEVYNLDVGLGRTGGGSCEPYTSRTGLGLIVRDPSVTELTRRCAPFAGGNVQNSLVFKATATGTFYLTVLPHSSAANVFGNYMLRVLPRHDEPGAQWDHTTAEPNNRNEIAYEILPGLANAQTRTIEERNVAYTTSFVDIDVFRINAVQGRTYVVELFNVDAALASDGGANCESYANHRGLAMVLYQPDNVEVKRQCSLASAGNVHNSLQFTAQFTGPYYVNIYPNANTTRVFGTYHIRVLPKYDEEGAAWDSTTFEPNNQLVNAYPINIGRLNAISSTIEARAVGYSTHFTDIDYYRFQGEADQRYVVELFNVDSNLGKAGGSSCESYSNHRGLALFIFSPVRDKAITGRCAPSGHGNVHSLAEFTADSTGQFFIQIYANSNDVAGSYQLRVLPAYDTAAASWDIGMEPNNRLTNAYPLPINPCSVRTAVDPRRPSYLTNHADVDWFVFTVTQNEQYKLALSAIEATLQVKGLYLQLHNREGTQLQRKLGKTGVEITFTAGYTGPYYAAVYPEDQSYNVPSNSSGSYLISASETLRPACDGTPPPPAAVEGAISTAPNADGRMTIVVPRGGNQPLTITIRTQCTVAQNVQLFVGPSVFTMISVSDSLYQATINIPQDLPAAGSRELNAHYYCSGQLYIVAIAPTLEFHDPSGQITDANTGQPIKNATVTLYRVPNALPDLPGQTRDCRTVDTRGGSSWNHLPSAEITSGIAIDPLTDALNGMQQINPQANPQLTGSEGRYAWDVVEGCWFIIVEAAGYARKISPLVGVPPAVTDLHLALAPASLAKQIYLPLIRQ
ncbi:MAG: hypothetical protein KF832_30765 [Caldilineaceae bacterium]|nr:hypothetical protein [Caldilineaceae bacterium]